MPLSGVRNVWNRNGLYTFRDRTIALLDHLCENKAVLTEKQAGVLKKAVLAPGPSDGAWKNRLRFESLISELSALFINLPVARIHDAINNAQKRVCEALGLDRSLLLEFSNPGNLLRPTHVWCADHVTDRYPVALTQEWEYFTARFRNGATVIIEDVDKLPEGQLSTAAMNYLKLMGATSIAGFPFNTDFRVRFNRHTDIRIGWPPLLKFQSQFGPIKPTHRSGHSMPGNRS